MQILNDLSFRWKLAIPLLLIAFIIVLISYSGISGLKRMDEDIEKISHEYLPALDVLLQADRDLYQAQVAERGLIIVEANTTEFNALIKQQNENIGQVKQRLGKFGELIENPKLKEQVKKAIANHAIWKPLTLKVVTELKSNQEKGRKNAIKLSFGEASNAFDNIRDIIDQLTEAVEEEAEAATQLAIEQSKKSMTSSVIAVIIGLSMCLVAVIVLPLFICRMMNRILERVRDISSGHGDLTVRIDVNGKDELGTLSSSFNQFLDTLQSLILKVIQSSKSVSTAAESLSSITRENHGIIVEQQQKTEQVASAITEMSSSVQEVVKSTGEAANLASHAMQESQKGQQTVQKNIKELQQLSEAVDNASEVVKVLHTNSEDIGSVLDVIKGIAEQTNLLALNAAIEAARAGEQGRGFAVVADEVRTLASKTQESAAEIEQMIETLQGGAKNAVQVMEQGREKANSGVNTAGEAGAALEGIIESISTIKNMNLEIANAAGEQGQVAEDIDSNIHSINNIANISSENSKKNENSSHQLSELANELQEYVHQFKV